MSEKTKKYEYGTNYNHIDSFTNEIEPGIK